jgi:hypothetical protein
MDIQGLVNHNPNPSDERRFSPLSPPDHSESDSARSQLPADSVMLQPSPYYSLPLRNRDEIYSPHYQLPNSTDQTTSPYIKRHLTDRSSPTLNGGGPPAKRRIGEAINREDGTTIRTRRRALQACESCRAKKSKCDNGRPSCGSCLQHGLHCVYKGAPSVTVYATLPD